MGAGGSTAKHPQPAASSTRMQAPQEAERSVPGVPEWSATLSHWRVYIGCRVQAGCAATVPDSNLDVRDWLEGTIVDVSDELVDEDGKLQRGINFLIRAEDGRTWPGEDQELDFAWEEVIGEDRENGTYFRWRDMTPAARDHAERAAEWLLEHDSGPQQAASQSTEFHDSPPPPAQPVNATATGPSTTIGTFPPAERSGEGNSEAGNAAGRSSGAKRSHFEEGQQHTQATNADSAPTGPVQPDKRRRTQGHTGDLKDELHAQQALPQAQLEGRNGVTPPGHDRHRQGNAVQANGGSPPRQQQQQQQQQRQQQQQPSQPQLDGRHDVTLSGHHQDHSLGLVAVNGFGSPLQQQQPSHAQHAIRHGAPSAGHQQRRQDNPAHANGGSVRTQQQQQQQQSSPNRMLQVDESNMAAQARAAKEAQAEQQRLASAQRKRQRRAEAAAQRRDEAQRLAERERKGKRKLTEPAPLMSPSPPDDDDSSDADTSTDEPASPHTGDSQPNGQQAPMHRSPFLARRAHAGGDEVPGSEQHLEQASVGPEPEPSEQPSKRRAAPISDAAARRQPADDGGHHEMPSLRDWGRGSRRKGHATSTENGNNGSSNREPAGPVRGNSDASTRQAGLAASPAGNDRGDDAIDAGDIQVASPGDEDLNIPDAARDLSDHAGKIKAIRVINFKNHEHFEMKFGLYVTIVHGQNGTGKSAIMQALQLCLGASARDTDAAQSVKSFIKTGETEATACVWLWNTGEEAYRPHEFGDIIEIERRISARGSNSFKLKSRQGKTVATGVGEVKQLMGHFLIDASNPVVCLTQDTAKGVQQEKPRFEHFLKANQLDEIIVNYEVSNVSLDEIKAQLQRANGELQEKKARVAELQKAVEALRDVRRWSEAAQLARIWIPWARVEEMEARIASYEDMIANASATAQVQEKLQAATEAFDAAQEELQRANADAEEVGPRLQRMGREMERLKEQRQEAVRNLRVSQANVGKAQQMLAHMQQESQQATERTAELRTELQSTHAEAAARHAQYEEQRRAARENVDRLEVAASDAHGAHREAQAMLRSRDDEARAMKAEHNSATGTVQRLQSDLASLRGQAVNPVTAFGGQGVPMLMQRVGQNLASFHRPPVQPLGSLLTLVDDADAVAVQMGLGRLFKQWLVHDQHDYNLLRKMSQGLPLGQLQATVTSFNTPLHNLALQRQPPAHLRTLLKAVRIADHPQQHTIQNIMVDLCNAESVVIVNDRIEARNLLNGPFGQQGVVRNTWTKEGRRMYKTGSTITEVPERRDVRPHLRKNLQGQMDELQQRISAAQQEAQGCVAAVDEAIAAKHKASQAVAAAREGVKQAAARKLAAEVELDNLDGGAAAADASQTEQQLAAAERDERLHENLIRAQQAQVARKEQDCEDAQGRLPQLEQELAGCDQRRLAVQASGQTVTDVLERAAATFKIAEAVKAKAEASCQLFDQKLAKARSDLADFTVQLQDRLAVAMQGDTREAGQEAKQKLAAQITEDREVTTQGGLEEALSADRVQHRHNLLEKRIAAREQSAGGNIDDVEEEWTKGQAQCKKAVHMMKNPLGLYRKLSEGLKRREQVATRIRYEWAKQLSTGFRTHMWSLRRWLGWIKVDYPNRLVEIYVDTEPPEKTEAGSKRKAKKKGMSKDLKALSGGERSFVNTCYTLAQGDLIPTPFHCLDEIDVFMDAQNRMMAFEGALAFALNNGKQLILLTPLPIDFVDKLKEALTLRASLPQMPPDFLRINQMPAARPQNQ